MPILPIRLSSVTVEYLAIILGTLEVQVGTSFQLQEAIRLYYLVIMAGVLPNIKEPTGSVEENGFEQQICAMQNVTQGQTANFGSS